jgi:hypothetical protein
MVVTDPDVGTTGTTDVVVVEAVVGGVTATIWVDRTTEGSVPCGVVELKMTDALAAPGVAAGDTLPVNVSVTDAADTT